MKIAIICSSFFPVIDGVTIAIFNRVKQLSKLGHQVKLFCPDYSSIAYIYPDWQDYTGYIVEGIEVINLPSTKSLALEFERDVTSKSYKTVIKELEEFKPDIIHVDEAERLGICFLKVPGVKFAREHNIPCVAWFHTNYIDYFDDYFQLPFGINKLIKKLLELLFAKIYNAYDLTLVSSSVTAQKLSSMNINNVCCGELLGFDFDAFNNKEKQSNLLQQEYNLYGIENKVKLIFISRLTPDKGWNFAIEAFAKLPTETISKIAIIVAGDGELKEKIENSLKRITPNVYLLGRISPQLVPSLLQVGDIFVTTSLKETRGLTLIEAAAAGEVAIASRAGGIIDTIIDGETGLLYEPQNQKDFLDKLTLLINDANLRNTMGAKAYQLAQQWSWQNTVNNLVEIWLQQIELKNNLIQ